MRMLTQLEVVMSLAKKFENEDLDNTLACLLLSSEKIETLSKNPLIDLGKKRSLIEKETGNLLLHIAIIANKFDIDIYDIIEHSKESVKEKTVKEKAIKDSKKKAGVNDEQLKRVQLISKKSLSSNTISTSSLKDIVKEEALRVIRENKGLTPPKTKYEEIDLTEDDVRTLKEEIKKRHSEKNQNGRIYPNKEKLFNKQLLLDSLHYLEENKDYRGSFLIKLLKTEQEIKNEFYNSGINEDESLIKAFKENTDVFISVYDIVATSKDLKRFVIVAEFNELLGLLKYKKIIKRDGLELSNNQRRELNLFLESKKLISDETVR